MIICCLDQATKHTGYSVWVDGSLSEYGVLSVNTSDSVMVRMENMYQKIKDLIVRTHPDYVCIEEVQQQVNPRVFKTLAQFQGVLFALLFNQDIGFCIVEPSCWKSSLGVKSRKREEQKLETQSIVKDLFNVEVTEDEADSIAIGCWAIKNITVN